MFEHAWRTVDDGDVGVFLLDVLHGLLGVRLRERLELAGADVVRPRLEELDRLSAALDLTARVLADLSGEMVEGRMEHLGGEQASE